MPFPRFRIRALMITVAVVAAALSVGVWLKDIGLGEAAMLAGLLLGALALGTLPGLVMWWSDTLQRR